MSEFAKFATRFHKIKRDMQDVEEVTYARLLEQRSRIRSRWLTILELERQTRAKRATSLDRLEWHTYDAYQKSLALERTQLEMDWNDMSARLNDQQAKLQLAYVEQEKWGHILDNALISDRYEEERRNQMEADESALRLFERRMVYGDSSK